MAEPWTSKPLLGFDTETTGVNVSEDRIVTIALVHSVGPGRENETAATWLINPGMPIPEAASRVHGITTEHARAHGMQPAPALDEAADIIVDALRQEVPLVAFNGSFDVLILEAELARHELPTLTDRLGHDVAPMLDPLVIDRGLDRYRKGKRTLADVMEHYGVETTGRLHTADADVRCTLDVLRAQIAQFPAVGDSPLPALHQQQAVWHREWAENLREYLASQGRESSVNLSWPM